MTERPELVLCAYCGRPLADYGAACPDCHRSGWRAALGRCAGVVAVYLAAVLLLAYVVAQAGCSSWQQGARSTLAGIGEMASRAPSVARTACVERRDKCKNSNRTTPDTCPELETCHEVEDKIARLAVVIMVKVLVGLAAVEAADKPTAGKALAEAVRLFEPVRAALKSLGVTL